MTKTHHFFSENTHIILSNILLVRSKKIIRNLSCILGDTGYLHHLMWRLFKRQRQSTVNQSERQEKREEKPSQSTLCNFANVCITRKKRLGKIRTSEIYRTAIRSFMNFTGNNDIKLENITQKVIGDYERWLKNRNVSSNTVSFYMRALRSLYNQAIDEELCMPQNPFANVYTGIPRTTKRAISQKELKRIKELPLYHLPSLAFARDIFLFSFYTRGMSFVDIAFLKKTDVRNNKLIYRRRKTNQEIRIEWESCMQEMTDRYSNALSPYLLPIITRDGNERQQYLNMQHQINTNLKKIARLAKINTNLTFYCARHSWASIAKYNNIPLSVISDAMGHESESTTRIYLASFDDAVIDNVNKKIIQLLCD